MSKHVSRKQRWTQDSPSQHTSALGKVVNAKGAWFGLLDYQTLIPSAHENGLPGWLCHSVRLGPFKRPRNAMVAVEREAAMLRNRHGEHVRFSDARAVQPPFA
ncbi:MAG TPA: hypothetical protein VKU02_08830 [Gemmataceae bacterium]|nr:hypothetical protein [Gemmataceae bacterium]